MSLPETDDLTTMDYAYQGQPFVWGPAKAEIDLITMDYAYQGQPFVTNPYPSVTFVPLIWII